METLDYFYIGFAIVVIFFLLIGWSKAQYVKGLKMALGWIAILIAVTGGVIYWDDFRNTKFYTSLVPGSAIIREDGSMEFSRSADGHFHILANIDGKTIEFLVDTGATDIALTKQDAEKIGIKMENLKYDRIYRTANGMTRGATVKLSNINVGKYNTGVITASVNEGDLSTSLLGLGFLNLMSSYQVKGDKLILHP